MSRSDLKELGEALDDGNAALIVIGESRVDEQIEKAVKRAKKVIEKQIDAEADELKRQVEGPRSDHVADHHHRHRGHPAARLRLHQDATALGSDTLATRRLRSRRRRR